MEVTMEEKVQETGQQQQPQEQQQIPQITDWAEAALTGGFPPSAPMETEEEKKEREEQTMQDSLQDSWVQINAENEGEEAEISLIDQRDKRKRTQETKENEIETTANTTPFGVLGDSDVFDPFAVPPPSEETALNVGGPTTSQEEEIQQLWNQIQEGDRKVQELKKMEEIQRKEAEIQYILEQQRLAAQAFLSQMQNTESKKPKEEKKEEKLPCPICSKLFNPNQIEEHVNACLDGGGTQPENNIRNPPSQPPEEKQEVRDDAVPMNGSYVTVQEEYLKYWKKKIEQEEADRLLALKLMQEVEQQTPAAPSVEENLTEDEKLALALQKEEEEYLKSIRAKEEADKKLAEELTKKEQDAEEARKKKREWEEMMNLIRQEAKTEADAELARLLKEKEELEAQLEHLRHKDNSVSLTLKDIQPPDYWSPQVSDFQSFDVAKGSNEWYKVSSEFLKGLPHAKLIRIERIQNRPLWMWYYLKREQIAANNKGNPNEKFLFHGSRNDAYDIILKEGLDHRVANLGGAIGAGIYFATSSATSAGYVSGGRSTKKMLYVRVTLGDVGPGQHGLRRPPQKHNGTLYDSVGNPTMYVIFDNHQSYPEYVLHYQ